MKTPTTRRNQDVSDKRLKHLSSTRCHICDFIRSRTLADLKTLFFSLFSTLGNGHAGNLILAAIVIGNLSAMGFSLSIAGCILVAFAILIAGFHNYWKAIIEAAHFEQSMNLDKVRKKVDISNKGVKKQLEIYLQEASTKLDTGITDLKADIAGLNLGTAEFTIAFVGTLLWGFGSTDWPCFFSWQCN